MRTLLVLLTLILPTQLLAFRQEDTAKQSNIGKPNIIVFLVDDLAWADVGYNGGGNGFYETPNIDKLAKGGMVLNRFYPGGPNCAPTRACMMTGMYSPRTKIYQPSGLAKGDLSKMRFLVPARKQKIKGSGIVSKTILDPKVTSVAEILDGSSYVTARFGKWHLGPNDQGFDYSNEDGTSRKVKNGVEVRKKYYNDPLATDRITKGAEEFLDRNAKKPFFLYLPLWDVHTPLVAKKKVIAKYRKKWETWPDKSKKWNPKFAAMIEVMDSSLGRIQKKLKDLKIDQNTLILFASDNGGPGGSTSNLPLRGAKGSLYEGGIRTAAVAYWPAKIRPGTSTNFPITGVDLLPTIAELTGSRLPNKQPVDGKSLAGLIQTGKAPSERSIFWHYPLYLSGRKGNRGWPGDNTLPVYKTKQFYWRAVPASAIMKGDWKLIYYYEYESFELFHIGRDPGEKNDLSKKNPEKAKELHSELIKWVKSTKADIPTKKNPLFKQTP